MLDRAVAEPMAGRLGDDGLKHPDGQADIPVGNRPAAVRGLSDERR
jgi:hypothetical protein